MRLLASKPLKSLTAVVAAGFCCTGLLSCTGAGSAAGPHTPPAHNYGPVSVSGRAVRPTDVSIGGIELTSPAKELSLDFVPGQAGKGVITYSDWNTITDTSDVPPDVGLMLDPAYNAGDIVRNRFQYLADRIWVANISAFSVMPVNSFFGGGTYTSTFSIYNPTDQVIQISDLLVKVTSVSSKSVLTSHEFYDAQGTSGCIVPARTIYFAFLEFPKPLTAPGEISDDISYNTLVCAGQVCPQGTPISQCDE